MLTWLHHRKGEGGLLAGTLVQPLAPASSETERLRLIVSYRRQFLDALLRRGDGIARGGVVR